MRAELGRNDTLSHRDHLLLPQRILESKKSRDELLRIAQWNEPLISQNRVRDFEYEFPGFARSDWSIGFDFQLPYVVMRTGLRLLVRAAINKSGHCHDVLLDHDSAVICVLDADLHY